jgi:hypothetical protein
MRIMNAVYRGSGLGARACDWWLVAGGWLLVAGGWSLVTSGWSRIEEIAIVIQRSVADFAIDRTD